MIKSVPFQTRARTIDHLGREQIADCPTAISELWKNAYDAYARNVSLDVFDGDVPISAISDDGHGMSEEEFLNRWLVVGTDSKLTAEDSSKADRQGLPKRTRQGQKGIGRLSCAALGPMALIVSKRAAQPFVAALLDWRLFENPYLLLHDIELPVVTFERKEELPDLLGEMADMLVANVWGNKLDKARTERVEAAWMAFDELEARQGRPSTRQSVEETVIKTAFADRHFTQWSVWNDTAKNGTLMLAAGLAYDLTALLERDSEATHDSLLGDSRDRMFRTLSSFVDPFNPPADERDEFHYKITAWRGEAPDPILSDKRDFDFATFGTLEHIIEGEVGEDGVFKGRVKAFGKWLKEHVTIPPAVKVPTGPQTRIGAFKFRTGAYEGTQINSTLTDIQYATIDAQAERYSGLFLFRDGLRVLPFGRPDNDFFEIERRRTTSVGREFWSYRRMFGSIGIGSERNPNLRDKAGREGLIDNQCAKVFRQIVEGILKESARRYFGTQSEIRGEKLEDIRATNRARRAKEEQRKLAKKRRDEFRARVRDQAPALKACFADLNRLQSEWADDESYATEKTLLGRRSALSAVEQRLHELDVGEPPHGLQSFSQESSEYASLYAKAVRLADELSNVMYGLLDELKNIKPVELFEKERSKRQRDLESMVNRHVTGVARLQAETAENLREIGKQQISAYVAQINVIYREVMEDRIPLAPALKRLDEKFTLARSDAELFFRGITAAFEALHDNIDLNAVAASGMDDLSQLREELAKINALAQLGITVEIIGHELESLDASISRGLDALPADVRNLPAFRSADRAHRALTERLRFLSPLKLSGEQTKEWISGKEIAEHIRDFFGEALGRENITLSVSGAFASFRVYDRPSRIFPVFINLVNNSRYWIAQKKIPGGTIALAVRAQKVVVADDGPGVKDQDVKNLFTLFFTRKARGGRGVGLYLCRTNLAAGGHEIRYADQKSDQVLPGANFTIEFLGAEYG